MTMITPSYLGETIEYSSLHACRSTLEDPTWETNDPARSRAKMQMVDCFLAELPPRLRALDVSPDLIAALLSPWSLESEQRHLSVLGGAPWGVFRNELESYRRSYIDASLGYKIYKALVLGLTLVMPPARFYQMKQWYAKQGLRRIRERIGSPVPAEQPIRTVRRSG